MAREHAGTVFASTSESRKTLKRKEFGLDKLVEESWLRRCISASFPEPVHLRSIPNNMKLTVYTAPWCRDCHVAKRWLAQNNIAYQEIDIEETPGAAEEVIRRTGKRAIPQFVIDGAWVQPYVPGEGFKYAEMAELFGISQP